MRVTEYDMDDPNGPQIEMNPDEHEPDSAEWWCVHLPLESRLGDILDNIDRLSIVEHYIFEGDWRQWGEDGGWGDHPRHLGLYFRAESRFTAEAIAALLRDAMWDHLAEPKAACVSLAADWAHQYDLA